MATWDLYELKEELPQKHWNGDLKHAYTRIVSKSPVEGAEYLSAGPTSLSIRDKVDSIFLVTRNGDFANYRHPFTGRVVAFFPGDFISLVDQMDKKYGSNWNETYSAQVAIVRR